MTLLLGLTSACFLFYLAFILRCARYFQRIPCPEEGPSPVPFVSVIIPARNEAANIEHCLRSVLRQSYPRDCFEVILVNDHSTDDTAKIARSLLPQHPQLQVWDLPDQQINAYKKAALTYGIHRAKGEIIVQTDADCWMGEAWLERMIASFSPQTGLVSGPVRLTYRDNWLEKLQSLELMGLVGIGAGSLAAGAPNMCNGANLAYRKTVFEEVGGFAEVDGVASGDDEFLLHKVHQSPWQLAFTKCPEAIVLTPAQPDWPSLKAQRLRWVSKARSYQNRWVNVVQLLSYLGFWLFPLLLGLSLWQTEALWGFLLAFGLKLGADYVLMSRMTQFFQQAFLMRYLIPLQGVYIPYVLWIGIAGNLVQRYRWKDRSVR